MDQNGEFEAGSDLFPGRLVKLPHVSTRQYARIVHRGLMFPVILCNGIDYGAFAVALFQCRIGLETLRADRVTLTISYVEWPLSDNSNGGNGSSPVIRFELKSVIRTPSQHAGSSCRRRAEPALSALHSGYTDNKAGH